ncbi:hypothetical protein D9M68_605660 [compost metagenome]
MKPYRIFISHSWKYASHYDRLYALLDQQRSYFDFADYSAPQEYALDGSNRNVWEGINERIRLSQAIIIPAGVYVTHSESITKEIEIAQSYRKPIIAVKPRENEYLSQIAVNASWVAPVGWNGASIAKSIISLIG